jgi:dipeptidyl aminopeptidase/acylaminoacyl peptidase
MRETQKRPAGIGGGRRATRTVRERRSRRDLADLAEPAGMMRSMRHARGARVALAIVLAAFAVEIPAAQRAITHEDLWLMKRVAAPQVSPDGRWAAFVVVEPAYDGKSQISDIWIVPTDGSRPARRMTSTAAREGTPAWRPDSRMIAFAAQREGDESEQIYTLALDGGEALRVSALSSGAASPVFSPDGTQLAFESSVYPGTLTDEGHRKEARARRDRKWNARIYDGFPIRSWDRWLDDRQVQLYVMPVTAGGAQAGAPRNLLAGTNLVKSPGYAARATDASESLDAVWTPDGQGLVFAATTNRHRSAFAFGNYDLYYVPAVGAEPTRLTRSGDSFAKPQFSPDGRSLYALREAVNDRVYNLTRLAARSWPAGTPDADQSWRVLTAEFDLSVTSYALPRGREIFLLAERAGHEQLFALDAARASARPVIELTVGAFANLSSSTTTATPVLLANYDSAANPPEIVRIEPRRGAQAALTSFNGQALTALELPPVRHFWFTSRRGRRIHNMLVVPAGFDPQKRYPLFNVIHGGPHSMFRDQWVLRWNYHLLAAPGYVVLLTNYSGSTGFGEQFAQHIQGDPLRSAGEELNEAVDAALKEYAFIDRERHCAGGASYGGHLANWLQATTTRYRCLVSHAGLVNLESQWGTSDTVYGREINNGGPVWEQGPVWREQNPIRYAAAFKTPTLVTVGELDFRVPMNNAIEYWTVLQRQQVPSRLIVFPDENHWVLKGENSRLFYAEIHAWLARWLR